ncbi:MAG TPA: hypothetical protein VNT92_09245 [Acidimicrobiia bacterium]|nr:hypothetical protein [Acidimicrobiia bacterium]
MERDRRAVMIGRVVTAVIAGWIIFVVVGGLQPVGRHFLILGVLRLALLAALIGLALSTSTHRSRLGKAGLGIAAVGAVANLAGGVGSVVTDGWNYDPFGPGADASPPWYAFVIGLSAGLFALASILTGIAARSAGWLALTAVVGGVLYPATILMQGIYGHDPGDLIGHLIWIAPWFVLGLGLSRSDSR